MRWIQTEELLTLIYLNFDLGITFRYIAQCCHKLRTPQTPTDLCRNAHKRKYCKLHPEQAELFEVENKVPYFSIGIRSEPHLTGYALITIRDVHPHILYTKIYFVSSKSI